MIDQLTIDKIRDTAQILDVVSDYVSLRRRGQNYVGLCPFHADKNPSFYVSPSKNICKCFSCNEGGDPIHFIMKHEQIGYLAAIRLLAKKYGIEIKERELTPEEKAAQTAREGMLRLNEFAMQTFENDLFETDEGRNIGLAYFRERGLQDETIKRFHLGYAVEKRTDLAERAIRAGHPRELLLDPTEERKEGVGLCYADNDQQMPQCRFHGRVIFPFMSLSGQPVAFGGRILQRVDHAFKKYVNSPESIIYRKGNMLYGLFQAKADIAKQDKCFIVEGNVDVLSMSQAGFPNVIASAGTALTISQIGIIRRFTKNVTLMFDGDDAGIRASLKTIDFLLLEGMRVKLLLFPDGDDPDSFCSKHTTEELQQFFAANEQDFVMYKSQMLLREAGTDPQKKADAMFSIAQSISLVSDLYLQSDYIHSAAQMLNIGEIYMQRAVQEARRKNYEEEVRRTVAEMQRQREVEEEESRLALFTSPTEKPERNIVRLLVRHGGDLFNYVNRDAGPEAEPQTWRVVDFIGTYLENADIKFQNPLYAKMLRMALIASEDPSVPFDSLKFFTQHADSEVNQMALDLAEDRNEAFGIVELNESLEKDVPRVLLELQDAILRTKIDDLNRQLQTPGSDTIEIMRQLTECNELKKQIGKELGERIITA
ncbi:MAG: DNA primase [Bacteroidales bacterium]|jgi:DNA primase|nr:DNA primase [Bacteroidales bacterium]